MRTLCCRVHSGKDQWGCELQPRACDTGHRWKPFLRNYLARALARPDAGQRWPRLAILAGGDTQSLSSVDLTSVWSVQGLTSRQERRSPSSWYASCPVSARSRVLAEADCGQLTTSFACRSRSKQSTHSSCTSPSSTASFKAAVRSCSLESNAAPPVRGVQKALLAIDHETSVIGHLLQAGILDAAASPQLRKPDALCRHSCTDNRV